MGLLQESKKRAIIIVLILVLRVVNYSSSTRQLVYFDSNWEQPSGNASLRSLWLLSAWAGTHLLAEPACPRKSCWPERQGTALFTLLLAHPLWGAGTSAGKQGKSACFLPRTLCQTLYPRNYLIYIYSEFLYAFSHVLMIQVIWR